MSNSYSLVDIGTKVAPAINPTITGASAQVTNSVSAAGSTVTSVAQAVGAAGVVVLAALEGYKIYASKDDHRLLAKILMEDCGGLSKMTTEIEGCYRQYVSKATHRSIMSPSYVMFQSRFQECFAKRQVHPCSFWGEDVFTSTGG